MSQTIPSPADRTHAEALAAHTANEDAIRSLRSQREKLLEDEDAARAALARGRSSPKILAAITDNLAQAAALVPAIESLEAARPGLIRAVDRAVGEQWAEAVRELAPEGTLRAAEAIQAELAEAIRGAVEDARARTDALATEAAHLEDQARRLHQRHALPAGVTYGATSGVTVDGTLFLVIPGHNLGALVGRQLDAEHTSEKRAAAFARAAA